MQEVENGLVELGRKIGDLQSKIDSGEFSGEVLEAAQNTVNSLSKQKQKVTNLLEKAKDYERRYDND